MISMQKLEGFSSPKALARGEFRRRRILTRIGWLQRRMEFTERFMAAY